MRRIAAVAVAVCMMVSAVASFAATFDGSYTFKMRVKEGKPDMPGWTGTMSIKEKEMTRNYKSPDGKETKFYTSSLKEKSKDGKVMIVRHIKAYKPEYVGNEFSNAFNLNGNDLVIESEDGKFKETWSKK